MNRHHYLVIRSYNRVQIGREIKRLRDTIAKENGDWIKPAYIRSFGVPDLARTSRSTRLMDISPRVSPDINPANKTRNTMIPICMKKLESQHLYSTAILVNLLLVLLLPPLPCILLQPQSPKLKTRQRNAQLLTLRIRRCSNEQLNRIPQDQLSRIYQ